MNPRIARLRSLYKQQGADACLISNSSNIFYLSGFNRFLVDHDGFLLVTDKSVFLITSPLYTEAVRQYSPDLALLETTPSMWYAEHIKKVATEENIQKIGFEENDLRVAEYFDLQDAGLTLQSVFLRNLRIQKDETEIAAIQKACSATDKVFDHILTYIKEGVSELELANEMEKYSKEIGSEIGFPSIVAFGIHSAVPHHMTSTSKLEKNNFVLFDFGLRSDGYLSDMSRTVFFGNPTDEQKRLYESVRESQKAAVAFLESRLKKSDKPSGKETDEAARNVIKKAGFPVYPHALGHGVGLDVHEAPGLSQMGKDSLLEGMVFTIEPGIYVPSLGGVRIEDVYTIKQDTLIELTHSPKELIVI